MLGILKTFTKEEFKIKKIWKSLAAAVIAVCMCAAVPMVSMDGWAVEAATSYKNGDVNNDGVVSLSDITTFGKYLTGRCDIVNYAAADVNRDFLLDHEDSALIQKFIVEIVDELPEATAEQEAKYEATSVRNTNVEYMRYDYVNKITTSYTLTSVPYQDLSRDISVQENRVPDSGNTPVVFLRVGAGVGTGFIVGDNVIATAAHCVYDRTSGTFISSIAVDVCDDQGSQATHTYTPTSVHVPVNYRDYTEEYKYSCYDYALIYVDTGDDETLAEKHGQLNLGMPIDAFLENGSSVTASGFPGLLNGDTTPNSSYTRYKSSGNIQPFTLNVTEFALSKNLRFAATCCVSGGDSGGPLYTVDEEGNPLTAIGIVTGGGYSSQTNSYFGTFGVRVTTDILHFYLNNTYL